MLKVRETCTLGCPLVRRLAGIKEMKVKTITMGKLHDMGLSLIHIQMCIRDSWKRIGEYYNLNLTIVNDQVDQTFRFMHLDKDGAIRMDLSLIHIQMCIRDRYKAAAKFKYGPVWARAGYIQPTGQTLLAPHWSFMPGTYQGAEAGANFDYGDAGALSFSYMSVSYTHLLNK